MPADYNAAPLAYDASEWFLKMKAMSLMWPAARSLELCEVAPPRVRAGQVLVRVNACAVCRTDLHIVDGELPLPKIPIIPGHEIVGVVEEVGGEVDGVEVNDRVGIPWLGFTCGECSYCRSGRENLCPKAKFTGYHIDGGYAEYTVADARYAFKLPEAYDEANAAPLLCAGLIGYRSYRMIGDARRVGIYGFGSAAHIITQVAAHDGREVHAFTPRGRTATQAFAKQLGAVWAGASDEAPPEPLDAAIIFAPVGALVPEALTRVGPGGVVICAGIHMTDIPSFPYRLLWEERSVRSVANLTREDARRFLDLAPRVPVETHVERYSLVEANRALDDVRNGRVTGTAVLMMDR